MSMTGAIVNALAIVAGGAVGLLFQRGIPERVSKTVMIGLGLCVLYIGISGAFACQSILIVIVAMTLGADDFVPKPYSARVLVARINALLRRTTAAGERSTLVHKGLELDLARSMVTNTQTGTSTELTKNELRILSLLLSRAGKIVSRSAIMQDLWDSDAFVDDNTLTVNINRLRTTLEKIGIKGYLTTHRGQGYSV